MINFEEISFKIIALVGEGKTMAMSALNLVKNERQFDKANKY